MKESCFKYHSLYASLDVALVDIPNPTDEQIKQTKKAYWKCWFKHYHRQRRKERKEFTLGFDRQSLQLINQKRGKLSVSQFLYNAIAMALDLNPVPIGDKEHLDTIHLNLMQLICLVEELLDTQSFQITETILDRLEVLEIQFNTLKKQ